MHIPVLLKEVIEFLDPKPNENFIDATFGDGGHSLEILKFTAPNGKVLGIDWDQKAIENFDGRGLDSRSVFKYVSEPLNAAAETPRQNRSGVELPPISEKSRLILISGNFADIRETANLAGFKNVRGVLFDLGFRSVQIESGGRGFSFQKDEPLDMRYHATRNCVDQTRICADDSLTAENIINEWSERDLERIFIEYGEERNSKRIARAIVESRSKNRIKTTGELVEIVDRTYRAYGTNRIKILARVFQALRIAVNNEFENIASGLNGAWDVIGKDGKITAISFHSLEDRMVKNFFADKKKNGEGEILTKKPVTPSENEVRDNSRSRSAKLRVIKKCLIPNY